MKQEKEGRLPADSQTARRIKISKYLSRHLRHEPERLGLQLEPGGWVRVEDLLLALERNKFPVAPGELKQIVAESDKQRFAFDETGQRIRANQGHSVVVDLQLQPTDPPAVLYHGTGERSLPAILAEGICKMRRHHVHLSQDVETARRVGARHGRPAVLQVDAAAMTKAGVVFFRSANEVWLVEKIPPEFLQRISDSGTY